MPIALESFIIDDTTTLPTPGINVTYKEQDLHAPNTKRDDLGVLHKRTVRWGLRRIELRWPVLTSAEINTIRTATKGKEYFKIQYFSTQAGVSGVITEAYSGDFTYTLYTANNTAAPIWKDVSLAIIER